MRINYIYSHPLQKKSSLNFKSEAADQGNKIVELDILTLENLKGLFLNPISPGYFL